MNLKVARLFVIFTGVLALCSVAASGMFGLRLQADREVLNELRKAPECPPPPASKGKG